MNIDRRGAGRRGEQEAAAHLASLGMTLVAMNFTTPVGEVDLIMRSEDVLVFVEVKKRFTTGFGAGEEAVTPAKCRRIVRAAMGFIQRRGVWDQAIRFDVVVIEPGRIRHYPSAFVPDSDLTYY